MCLRHTGYCFESVARRKILAEIRRAARHHSQVDITGQHCDIPQTTLADLLHGHPRLNSYVLLMLFEQEVSSAVDSYRTASAIRIAEMKSKERKSRMFSVTIVSTLLSRMVTAR